jgi:predicted nucleotide-binding protein with TIR-like domain
VTGRVAQLVAETEHATPYIGQVLDRAMEVVQAVVVLFTPDDLVQLRAALLRKSDGEVERRLTGQPRPNVLFEAGLAFGRHPSRTVLVEHGELRGLSDLFGRHVVRLERGASALHELAQRLKRAGCRVDLSGEAWLDAARFPEPPHLDPEARSLGTAVATAPASRRTASTRCNASLARS